MQKLLIGFIGLNLLLGTYLGIALNRRTRPLSPVPDSANTMTEAKNPSSHRIIAPPPNPPRSFNWSDLASPDLRIYAQNLRRAGCPEQTIRDIMLAEVNRPYGIQAERSKSGRTISRRGRRLVYGIAAGRKASCVNFSKRSARC